jgi:Rhodopirellula transposase DDE domain
MDRATIVDLIAATRTKTGLKVECALDTRVYEKGIKVSKAAVQALNIRGDEFHPEWNYSVVPHRSES